MKNKTYTCIAFASFIILLIILTYIAGVRYGISVAGAVSETAPAQIPSYAQSGDVRSIQETYNYERIKAEGRCSGCSDCGGGDGSMYVIYPGFEDSFIEISGVGMFQVKSGCADGLCIYFNNCEDAENFGIQNVYVRRCSDDL